MDKKMALRLSLTFAAIYFFSTNGMASLPGLAVSYLLKDVLKMTASQASYFGAVTLLGWVIKPLWGMISDALPLFGYRRKSYLILTSLVASAVWFMLGQVENYTIALLLTVFTLSNFFYAFNAQSHRQIPVMAMGRGLCRPDFHFACRRLGRDQSEKSDNLFHQCRFPADGAGLGPVFRERRKSRKKQRALENQRFGA